MQDFYLSTDEQMDVLISLREVLHQVWRVRSNPHCWKWAIIALVSAANGALICNLAGTMQVGALRKGDRERMIQALQDQISSQGLSELPDVYLETPMKLLGMVASDNRFDAGAGPPICVTEDQRQAFDRLIRLRNIFMHFQPQSLSIAIADLPPIFLNVIGIVKAVAADGYSFRRLNYEDRNELTATCVLIEKAVV